MIQIIFDRQTKLKAMQTKLICFPEILEKAKEEITDTVPLSVFDFFGMTVAEFLQLQEQIMPKKILTLLSKRKTTFIDYIKVVNTFEQGMKSFERIVEDTTISLSKEDEASLHGLINVTPEQSMISFLKRFYPNSDLEALKEKTLYEYVFFRIEHFNDVTQQLNKINILKSKK